MQRYLFGFTRRFNFNDLFFNKIIKWFFDFIEDRHCLICNAELPSDCYGLCNSCASEHIHSSYVTKYEGNILERRLYGLASVSAAAALMPYNDDNVMSRLIQELKYKNNCGVGEFIGAKIADDIAISERFPQMDYIVPVPLHPKKLALRGYNQSEIIAHSIAKQLDVPLNTTNLYRTRNNKSQTKKSRIERAKNVENLFALRDEYLFSGKNILLVDDVFTTGSTVISSANALYQSPDVKIYLYTAAVAMEEF